MIDSFVLVAPIYLLGVIALVGFVGCAQILGVEEWAPGGAAPAPPEGPQPPTNLHSEAGDGVVTLLWDPNPDALLFEIFRKIAPPGMPPASWDPVDDLFDSVAPAELLTINGFVSYEDHAVTNGITYHYVIRTVMGDGTSDFSGDIEATPQTPFGPFVTDVVPGTVRIGEDGWFGFAFVAVTPGITVHKLGRFYSPSNSGTHDINLIEAASLQILGKATVTLASEDLNGFKYANVLPAVQLAQDQEYFVVSLEQLGGDDFFTQDTTVITNAEAAVTNAVESAALVAFTTAGGPGHVYGPINFQY